MNQIDASKWLAGNAAALDFLNDQTIIVNSGSPHSMAHDDMQTMSLAEVPDHTDNSMLAGSHVLHRDFSIMRLAMYAHFFEPFRTHHGARIKLDRDSTAGSAGDVALNFRRSYAIGMWAEEAQTVLRRSSLGFIVLVVWGVLTVVES